MNKISKLTAIFLATVFLFSSCQNFLDTDSPSAFDEALIFSDASLAEGALLGAYHVLGINNSYRNRALIHTFSNADTEIHNSSLQGLTENGRRALAVYRIFANNTEMNHPTNEPFGFAYMAIERLNIIVAGIRMHGMTSENFDDPSISDFNTPALAAVYGEALALRAFFYFDLVKWYGDVPARFSPVSNETIFLPRTDRDYIYKQILDDLRIAANLLPWPGGGPSHNRVDRMNQAFARAFRARVALHAGGYSLRADDGFGGGEPQVRRSVILDRTEMYQIARAETLYLMENGVGFRLQENFIEIFQQNMRENVSIGRESIFELPYNAGTRGQWLSFFGARHDGEDMFNASSSLVKGEAGPTPIMWYWFNENDIRRDISIVPWRYSGDPDYASPTSARQVIQQPANTPMVRTWYFGRLRASWGSSRMPSNDDGIKPIVMRFADVLLMFAEAENFLNGATSARDNAFADVRERAFPNGGDPLTFRGVGQEEFLQIIMDERAFEFLGEQRRKYDLIRWNRLRANLDWAREQTLRMRQHAGTPAGVGDPGNRDIDFSQVPRHIFWRHVACNCAADPNITLCRGNHQVLELFGFNRGEFPREGQTSRTDLSGAIIVIDNTPHTPSADLVTWMDNFEGGGWQPYTGTGVAMIEWIDHRTDQNGRPLSDHFINNAFYMGAVPLPGTTQTITDRINPDLRSLLPIWATPILNSQGHLNNRPHFD